MTEYSHFDIDVCGEVHVITLRDAELLESLVTAELCAEVLAFLNDEKPRRVFVCFRNVKRLSSESISALLRCRDWCVTHDTELRLCELAASIREVFQLLNLDGKVFLIHETMNEALNSW